MAQENFYEELDLRYPEIAICLDKIDRVNPGKKKFMIPVLTPDVNPSDITPKENKIIQQPGFIENQTSVVLSPVIVRNYIEIVIPRELCAYMGQRHFVVGKSTYFSEEVSGTTSITSASLRGNGTVGPPTSYSSLSAYGSVTGQTSDKEKGSYHNKAYEVFDPVDRYIQPGSKWIVVFIGGDITKPNIISRYWDDTYVGVPTNSMYTGDLEG